MEEHLTWKILKEYFNEYGFKRHQFASYNDFISNGIDEIIKNEGGIKTCKYSVDFSEAHVGKPTIVNEKRNIYQ